LLATHAHNDHVGALAGIKKETGAKILINENDAPILADGGVTDYLMGGNGLLFEPAKPDGMLHDHDTVRLGGMEVIALHHPGHTKGATSFLFDIKDNNRSYRVLIANMPTILDGTKLSGMPTYSNIGKDYAATLEKLKNLQFDIFLSSHASQFGLHTKRKPGDGYNPQIFIDRPGYDQSVDNYKKAYQEKIK
jgi:metallo-beta-lactamase class B